MDNVQSTVQIIPFYAQPHVHTVINDNTFYDETVATRADDSMPYATCIVTGADQGIDNKFVRLNSLKVKKAIFGESNFRKYGQASLQADALFNGSTDVWFCRPLPDDATYANLIVLAKYRARKVLDSGATTQEDGITRMEIKFDIAYATEETLPDPPGATEDFDIDEYAKSLLTTTKDPVDDYMTVPLFYIRSIGRGNYGNAYSISLERDLDAEKEYGVKMYRWNLLTNKKTTRITNMFSGSLYQTTAYDMSTLISDVLDQFATGSCPVYIKPYEDSFEILYNFYKNNVVAPNAAYLLSAGATDAQADELSYAQNITLGTFDPLFGMKMNTRVGAKIPYYQNYTVKASGPYVPPDLTIPTDTLTSLPLSTAQWSTAKVGSTVLLAADPDNDSKPTLYTVTALTPSSTNTDGTTYNITYDEGVTTTLDGAEYNGVNIALKVGNRLIGGSDGQFESIITADGSRRAPTPTELQILLAREEVKIFHGEKDRNILSPARINLDFIFDANYLMVSDEDIESATTTANLSNTTTSLTNAEAQALAVLNVSSDAYSIEDLNVKKAMYDLNEFRNKNGMEVNPERGAGCSLYLDCGLVGSKHLGVNYELFNIINAMADMDGRATSIDLGYYDIFDPITGKRITVTVDYYIAKNLIPHLMKYGLNKPFTYKYATLKALQRSSMLGVSGNMIRDSFRPDIDLIDWDVKEMLYKSRINYYLTSDEGRTVERACQNTRQLDASALLEENNVRVLNTLKKNLEKACRSYLYEWNEPEVRKGYTDAQMQIYRPWIGTIVQDLNIEFTANEWEQERMIMHCYVTVKFRDIIKRIILEINIQRPTYGGDN